MTAILNTNAKRGCVDPDLLIKPDSLYTQLGLVSVTLIVVLVTILSVALR